MEKNSKIFLTGAHGMVGSAIKRKLTEEGYTNVLCPSSQELNLINQAETEAFFKENQPEYVFLAAAKVGGVLANSTYKADFIYNNLMISTNVIHFAYEYNAKRLLNLASSCVYPRDAKQPIKEETMLSNYPEETVEPYSIAKIAAIKQCSFYNFQYKTDFISLIPVNLFGFNDNFDLETSHLIPALIRKMILAKALMEDDFDLILKDIKLHKLGFGLDAKIKTKNKIAIMDALRSIGIFADEIEFWGTGMAKREFMYSDDVADACLFFMSNVPAKQGGDFINIGSGKELSVKQTIGIIAEILGYTGKIEFNPLKPEGVSRKLLDSKKANDLGWKYKTEFEDGLKKVIANYLQILKQSH